MCQAAVDAAESSGESGGALSFNRDAIKRQQGMLRFSAHLALSLPALGLLPLPHDMSASLAFRDLQVSSMGVRGCQRMPGSVQDASHDQGLSPLHCLQSTCMLQGTEKSMHASVNAKHNSGPVQPGQVEATCKDICFHLTCVHYLGNLEASRCSLATATGHALLVQMSCHGCRLRSRSFNHVRCVLQDSCNVLLQQYLVELMDSGQHSLMPVYACHLRADERREVSAILPLSRPDTFGSALEMQPALSDKDLTVCHQQCHQRFQPCRKATAGPMKSVLCPALGLFSSL